VSLSEEERIRKLEKEIEEVQNLRTTMFNELEVRARKWAELDKGKQRFEDMFAGFENKLAKIEAKMEEERKKSKAS
jgi:septal ring factor EnvC (AmiA/AmiB activator)